MLDRSIEIIIVSKRCVISISLIRRRTMFVFRKMSLLFFLSQSAMNLPLLNIAIILMNKIKFSRKLINFINKYERKKGKIHKICKFFIETNYIVQVNRIQTQIFINIHYV